MGVSRESARGLAALRRAVTEMATTPSLLSAGAPSFSWMYDDRILMASPMAAVGARRRHGAGSGSHGNLTPVPAPDGSAPAPDHGDGELATSSAEDEAVGTRLIALVELARNGDKEAFGQLYDHYQPSVYRFLYYRVGSMTLAEDLTAETFFRALRSMHSFRWQGKDFGAWLMTIARNLTADHFKAGRTRLEQTTEDMQTLDSTSESPEVEVLSSLTNEALLRALGELPSEQRECLIMRFLQGLSIAETAEILGRSSGAVKQLQLRGVRNLSKLIPAGERE
ncbi:MAG: sigma-70 family RNA polymerase sigma factor [Propionibacteriales bacterium]|nr:sigma-70 family RNA polymerase sigma factor [Propionibacteriales bacterium]